MWLGQKEESPLSGMGPEEGRLDRTLLFSVSKGEAAEGRQRPPLFQHTFGKD